MNSLATLFSPPADPALLTYGIYNPWLVALSVLAAVFASWVALHMVRQARRAAEAAHAAAGGKPEDLRSARLLRGVALATGSVALGVGVWAMHFVGMLAFDLCTMVDYERATTLWSVLPSLGASFVALWLMARPRVGRVQMFVGAVLVGAGIGAMHYTGMAAMRMALSLHYDPVMFALSIVVAVALAWVALWVYFGMADFAWMRRLSEQGRTAAAALAMGCAIAGMHYTGMAAARFSGQALPGLPESDDGFLVLAVCAMTVGFALAAVGLNGWLRYREMMRRAQAYETRQKALLAASVEGVITLNTQGQVEDFNPAAEALFGLGREQAIGRAIGSLLVEDPAARADGAGAAARAANVAGAAPGVTNIAGAAAMCGGQDGLCISEDAGIVSRISDMLALHADGRAVPVRASFGFRHQIEGDLFLVFVSDMTERREAEQALAESEAQLRSLVGSIPGIAYRVRIAAGWPLIYISDAVETLLGYKAQEFAGEKPARRMAELMLPEDQGKTFNEVTQAVRDGRPHLVEFRLRHRDGRMRWMWSNGRVSLDASGRATWLDGVMLDITERKEAELAVRQFQALVESSSDAIFATTLDGVVTSWNRGAEQTFGYGADEAIGRLCADLIGTDEGPGGPALVLSRAAQGERVEQFEAKRRRKDGTLIDISVTVSPILDARGRIVAASAIARDITARVEADQQLRRFQSLVGSTGDAIFSTTLDGIVTSWNRGAEKTYGYTAAEALGRRSVEMLYNPATPEEPARLMAVAARGERIEQFITRRYRKDRTLIDVSATISPIFGQNGEVTGISVISRDISERLRMEADLREAKEVAERAAESRSAFLANMSHEIRTPMNAVLGFTDVLLQGELRPEQRRHLDTIRGSGRALLRLLNEVLDIAKLDRGAMDLELANFNLLALVDTLTSTLAHQAREKGLAMQVRYAPGMPALYHGDELRVRQILINLLGNAVKFTASGSVTLEARPAEPGECAMTSGDAQAGPGLHLMVRDTGIGIAPERLAAIFDPFTQADASMSRRYGGTGLGTTIAKQLTELMGGRIWAESTPGEGSCFHVVLPLPRVAGGEGEEQGERGDAKQLPVLPPLRILAADDVPQNLELLELLLGGAGHEVHLVPSGTEAVARITKEHFDAVLMDVHMPGMDGLEAARRIRLAEAAGRRARVPIIALTASVQHADHIAAHEAGMDGFAAKPVELPLLLAELARVLELPAHGKGAQAAHGAARVIEAARQQARAAGKGAEGAVNANAAGAHGNTAGTNPAHVAPTRPGAPGMNPTNTNAANAGASSTSGVNPANANAAGMGAAGSNTAKPNTGTLSSAEGKPAEARPAQMNRRRTDAAGSRAQARSTHAANTNAAGTSPAGANVADANPTVTKAAGTRAADAGDAGTNVAGTNTAGTTSTDAAGKTAASVGAQPQGATTTQAQSGTALFDPNTPALDYEGALRRCGGKAASLNRLLGRFAEHYSDSARTLPQLARSGDYAAARDAAHKMRGVAANLGLTALMSLGAALEQVLVRMKDGQAQEGDAHALEGMLDALPGCMEQALAAIAAATGQAAQATLPFTASADAIAAADAAAAAATAAAVQSQAQAAPAQEEQVPAEQAQAAHAPATQTQTTQAQPAAAPQASIKTISMSNSNTNPQRTEAGSGIAPAVSAVASTTVSASASQTIAPTGASIAASIASSAASDVASNLAARSAASAASRMAATAASPAIPAMALSGSAASSAASGAASTVAAHSASSAASHMAATTASLVTPAEAPSGSTVSSAPAWPTLAPAAQRIIEAALAHLTEDARADAGKAHGRSEDDIIRAPLAAPAASSSPRPAPQPGDDARANPSRPRTPAQPASQGAAHDDAKEPRANPSANRIAATDIPRKPGPGAVRAGTGAVRASMRADADANTRANAGTGIGTRASAGTSTHAGTNPRTGAPANPGADKGASSNSSASTDKHASAGKGTGFSATATANTSTNSNTGTGTNANANANANNGPRPNSDAGTNASAPRHATPTRAIRALGGGSDAHGASANGSHGDSHTGSQPNPHAGAHPFGGAASYTPPPSKPAVPAAPHSAAPASPAPHPAPALRSTASAAPVPGATRAAASAPAVPGFPLGSHGMDEVRNLVATLAGCFERGALDDDALARLLAVSAGRANNATVQGLRRAVDDFDFALARSRLATLLAECSARA